MKRKPLALLSVLAIALSGATYAHKGPCQECLTPLFIPDLTPCYEFDVAALWLRPGASNLNYVIYNKELPAQSPTWLEREIQPDFDAGFELSFRYNFPRGEGQDVSLTWTHLNTSDSSSTVAPDASYFLGPDYEIGPAGIPIRNATGRAKFYYDVVNLDVGQYLKFGQHLTMRFFGGLSAASLQEKVKAVYTGIRGGTFAGPFSMTQKVLSDFSGIGPRFGVHADYDTSWCGFGFLGEIAGSALIGSLHSKTSYIGSGVELLRVYGQTTNYQTIKDQHVYQVIPALDTKLGINYKYNIKNCMLLTIAAGYQAAVYVNAISQYLPGTLVEGSPLESGGIFVATMNHTLSNYSVQGPFLNFTLQF